MFVWDIHCADYWCVHVDWLCWLLTVVFMWDWFVVQITDMFMWTMLDTDSDACVGLNVHIAHVFLWTDCAGCWCLHGTNILSADYWHVHVDLLCQLLRVMFVWDSLIVQITDMFTWTDYVGYKRLCGTGQAQLYTTSSCWLTADDWNSGTSLLRPPWKPGKSDL